MLPRLVSNSSSGGEFELACSCSPMYLYKLTTEKLKKFETFSGLNIIYQQAFGCQFAAFNGFRSYSRNKHDDA